MLLLATAVPFAASCSTSSSITPSDSSQQEASPSIRSMFRDGDQSIDRIAGAAAQRDYQTLFDSYERLRSIYVEVATQVEPPRVPEADLDHVLTKLSEWENAIERFRYARQTLNDPLPVDAELLADGADFDQEAWNKQIAELDKQFQASADEKLRREQQWTESESRLDEAISAVENVRKARQSRPR
ncbi:hypothetical protein [Pirellulimonas nuda]|nr:hypothetical protein [Pirellulimonas nuda]